MFYRIKAMIIEDYIVKAETEKGAIKKLTEFINKDERVVISDVYCTDRFPNLPYHQHIVKLKQR